MSTSSPHPTTHAKDTWILKAIFGASLLALAAFWGLMIFFGPASQQGAEDLCLIHQATVQRAFRTYCKKKQMDFHALLKTGKRGARLAPLIEELRVEGLLSSPPPSTKECRSWRDYLVLDLSDPTPEKISCRIHGINKTAKTVKAR
jgi:hypothetical protein